jgi:hypothetical protein
MARIKNDKFVVTSDDNTEGNERGKRNKSKKPENLMKWRERKERLGEKCVVL